MITLLTKGVDLMKKKRLLSLLMAAALFVGTAAALPENKLVDNTGIKASAATTTTGSVTRFAGDNRYDTAALISKASYKTSPTVVIADAMTFQDALIAVPLAKAYNAPLLLANPNLVTTQTEKELKRLNAKKVIIVNTNNALKPKTVNALKKYNPTIYKGRTCFETSKIVAEALQAKTKKAPTDVFFTTNKAFADALSISPVAALKGAPILYVDPSKKTLDSNILAYLKKVKGSIKNVYIVGGTVAVPKAIENSIKKALPKKNVKRFDGAQRYETCVMINKYFAGLLNSKTVCVAKGLDFPDALSGGVFAANHKAPLLLADGSLRAAQNKYLWTKRPSKIYVFGGLVAVSNDLVMSINTEAGNRVDTTTWHGADSTSESINTVRIYCWNSEFKLYFDKYYPKYGKYKVRTRSYRDWDTGELLSEIISINGKKIEWVQNTIDGNLYQTELDKALINQPYSENKVDMFLIEPDYAQKYVKGNVAMSVHDLGITDNDTKNMYQYLKDLGTVPNTYELNALAWNANVGLFYYDVNIAKKVLGTSDPAKVQSYVKDWNSFKKTAQKMKSKGYKMLSSPTDTFRVYASNISTPWVNNKKLNVDPQMKTWANQSRDFTLNGYNNYTDQWSQNWINDMKNGSKVFGYFLPDWGLENVLKGMAGAGTQGKWKACMGPAGWYWGGSMICGAIDSDNKDIVTDIMKTMTCNTNLAKEYLKNTNYMPNNRAAVDAVKNSYKNSYIGGQNHLTLMSKNADRIHIKGRVTPYDQGCLEYFQGDMYDYIYGYESYNDRLKSFLKRINKIYPELDTGYGSILI